MGYSCQECWQTPERFSSSASGRAATHKEFLYTFTFMHLADAFIQRVLQCIQAIWFYQYMCSLGIEPTSFGAANAMLYHWATGTLTFWTPVNPRLNHTACVTDNERGQNLGLDD